MSQSVVIVETLPPGKPLTKMAAVTWLVTWAATGLQEFDGKNLLKYNSLVVALIRKDLLVVHDVILVKGHVQVVMGDMTLSSSFRYSRIWLWL